MLQTTKEEEKNKVFKVEREAKRVKQSDDGARQEEFGVKQSFVGKDDAATTKTNNLNIMQNSNVLAMSLATRPITYQSDYFSDDADSENNFEDWKNSASGRPSPLPENRERTETFRRLSFYQPPHGTFYPVHVTKQSWWNKGKLSRYHPTLTFPNHFLALVYIAIQVRVCPHFVGLVKNVYSINTASLHPLQITKIPFERLREFIWERERIVENENEGVGWTISAVENTVSLDQVMGLIFVRLL